MKHTIKFYNEDAIELGGIANANDDDLYDAIMSEQSFAADMPIEVQPLSVDADPLPSAVVRRLAALEDLNFRFELAWTWNARSRDGVITVSHATHPVVFRCIFERNKTSWTTADYQMYRLRRGSQKLLAFAAIADAVELYIENN